MCSKCGNNLVIKQFINFHAAFLSIILQCGPPNMSEILTIIGLKQVRLKTPFGKRQNTGLTIGTFSNVLMVLSLESDNSFKKYLTFS